MRQTIFYPLARHPGDVHRPTLSFRAALVILATFRALYFAVLHPWIMTWGATADEQRMGLPGDEAGVDPSAVYFTRAITIHAPTSEVWAWLPQIGQDRAGFYSNTWLENLF